MDKYRIAIIEDDERDAERVKEAISKFFEEERAEYELGYFSTPSSFFDKYVSYYDMVLIDIEMPNMNGMEMARRLRDVNKDVVIIFITNLLISGSSNIFNAEFTNICPELIMAFSTELISKAFNLNSSSFKSK